MESDWERPPHFQIDRPALSRLIKQCIGESYKDFSLLAGGRKNTSYKIIMGRSHFDYVLRIYTEADDAWKKEQALYFQLKAILPLPEYIDGGFKPELLDKPFCLFRFVEGVTMEKALLNNSRLPPHLFEEIGAYLGKIHLHKYSSVGFLDEELNVAQTLPPLRSWYSMFLEGAAKRLDKDSVKIIETYLHKHDSLLAIIESDPVLVHGDFRPVNMLVDDNQLVAILDWEFSMAGHRFSDLGQFIRNDEPRTPSCEPFFIQGYCKTAEINLPPNWKQLAQLRDLVNLLQMLGNNTDMPRFFDYLKGLIIKIVTSSDTHY